jgi:cytochrome c1
MIAAVLLILLGLLFYVGRMLFLAAGTPGGNFDAPGDPDDFSALAEANNHGTPYASSLTPSAKPQTPAVTATAPAASMAAATTNHRISQSPTRFSAPSSL